MRRLLSKRNVLAVLLGLGGLLVAFAVAYAATVQWSRPQPSKVLGVQVQVLPDSAVEVYLDSALTQRLGTGDEVTFGVLQFQPPLKKFITPLRR